MTGPAASPETQQLLELLAVVTSFTDEPSAVQAAAERAAQALEAEVAAVVLDDEVVAAVGFPAGRTQTEDLLAIARGERDWIEVPGLAKCQAIVSRWSGTHPGRLIIARWGSEPFSVEERNLVRGMGRLMELTLTVLRTLEAEHRMRRESERQAAENARLLRSLREQQRLQLQVSVIQRAISRRDPLQQILETITAAAQDLLGDEIVGLWIRDHGAPDRATLLAAVGLDVLGLPSVPLADAGAAGEAMRRNQVVTLSGYERAAPVIRELTGGRLHASMAAPVHESGEVSGGLLVASYDPERRYQEPEADTLRTFAQNVSLALTDARTFEKMNRAVHDTLTGLAGRGLFMDQVAEQLARGEEAALLFIDLDGFKSVNDTLGHAAGDELLAIAAQRITSQLRPSDIAGRFGGDEFTVLLTSLSDARAATTVASRIIRALSDPIRVAGRSLNVGASVGIAMTLPDLPEPVDLLRRADMAMYQAKRNGRGRYEVFTQEAVSRDSQQRRSDPSQFRWGSSLG
ncbi:sensor domain-containing diguanylate cyclase [Actinospica robiniae]|uniref:sensor domain-containing diguanylate cyclase n=1 Tax=Actinospica robiniae TaxID=304901 RepID=UPI000423A0C6|nr:sensor domain-containing diguanylate cyclase [Actinospica robiniae]